jgi:glycosyltransferase involved in cell wall biosynthesis
MTGNCRASASLAVLLVALLTAGCAGYRLGPTLSADYKSVAVVMFKNKTLKPQLEAQITNGIIKRLQADGTLRVDSEANADIVVTGFIPNIADFFHYSRVFVAPLRYGAGLKGKIVHAMSYGVPVVTTDIGAEGLGLEDGLTALIAASASRETSTITAASIGSPSMGKICAR